MDHSNDLPPDSPNDLPGRWLESVRTTDLLALRDRPPAHVDAAWHALQPQLDTPKARHSATPARGKTWARIAYTCAAAIVLLAVGFATRSTAIWTRNTPSSQALVEHRTGTGERTRLQLPDGSTVLLNVGSRIRYAADFGDESRAVYLDGEALFTVTTQSGVPFVVHAGGLHTRVLGTSFAVRKYAEDSSVRVIVAEGRVALGDAVLATGDEGQGTVSHNIAVRRRIDVADALAWTNRELVFSGTPLREVIPALERWYGLVISVRDTALLNAPVTTTFTAEAPAQIIDVLARVLDARAERHEYQVTFHAR